MKNIESNFKESRIYTPNQKFVKSATVTDKILANLHDEYKNNPDLFWSNLAKQEISWIKEFTNVCVGNAPDFEWFREGKLNISENCLDRHIDNENNAIIHISEDNKKQIISYKELYQKVNNFSFALKSIDIKKGSRVIIYMPTIPESIIEKLS